MATTLTFTSAPFLEVTNFLNGDGTTAKTILAADNVNSRRLYGITLQTDETVTKDIFIQIVTPGGVASRLTTIQVLANAGNTNAIVPLDLFTHSQMAPIVKQRDASGASYLNIPAGWSLRLGYSVALVSPRFANVTVMGETYA